jgi:GMP synthase (glutamine-hydrolysing)
VKKLVVIQCGDPVDSVARSRGDFAALILGTMGATWPGSSETWDARRAEVSLPTASGYVLTGSSASVTERAPWMLRLEAELRRLAELRVPLFGICFGHQILAQALGGNVIKNPAGREIGSVEFNMEADAHANDWMLRGLEPRVTVNMSHVDTVATLPPGARRLGTSPRDHHAAFAVGDHIRAVQFHPEFDRDVAAQYIEARSAAIHAEGLDVEALRRAVREAPSAAEMLRRFAQRVAS